MVGGQVLVPQRIHERAGADGHAGVQREAGEQRAQAAAADHDGLAVVLDLERPEEPYTHPITVACRRYVSVSPAAGATTATGSPGLPPPLLR